MMFPMSRLSRISLPVAFIAVSLSACDREKERAASTPPARASERPETATSRPAIEEGPGTDALSGGEIRRLGAKELLELIQKRVKPEDLPAAYQQAIAAFSDGEWEKMLEFCSYLPPECLPDDLLLKLASRQPGLWLESRDRLGRYLNKIQKSNAAIAFGKQLARQGKGREALEAVIAGNEGPRDAESGGFLRAVYRELLKKDQDLAFDYLDRLSKTQLQSMIDDFQDQIMPAVVEKKINLEAVYDVSSLPLEQRGDTAKSLGGLYGNYDSRPYTELQGLFPKEGPLDLTQDFFAFGYFSKLAEKDPARAYAEYPAARDTYQGDAILRQIIRSQAFKDASLTRQWGDEIADPEKRQQIRGEVDAIVETQEKVRNDLQRPR